MEDPSHSVPTPVDDDESSTDGDEEERNDDGEEEDNEDDEDEDDDGGDDEQLSFWCLTPKGENNEGVQIQIQNFYQSIPLCLVDGHVRTMDVCYV